MSWIAKEGQKYGVSLCLVSQRPSNLLLNILSQCNTLFVPRISNDPNQDFVRDAVPESGLGLLNALTALRMQEAIVVGEGVTVPMRIRFDDMKPEHQPRRVLLQRPGGGRSIAETVTRWRHQTRSCRIQTSM